MISPERVEPRTCSLVIPLPLSMGFGGMLAGKWSRELYTVCSLEKTLPIGRSPSRIRYCEGLWRIRPCNEHILCAVTTTDLALYRKSVALRTRGNLSRFWAPSDPEQASCKGSSRMHCFADRVTPWSIHPHRRVSFFKVPRWLDATLT